MNTLSEAAVTSLINLAVKYGPSAVTAFIELFKKGNPTVDQVEAAFLTLKPYEAYNIPAIAPTAPVS